MDGVLVVDKPGGPTSHDVVRRVRRVLGLRAVGHAGTLDPAATGVLVLGIGEGTKLLPFLSADDKAYEARIALGAETDTLDAEGAVTAERPVPPLDRETVERAAAGFVGAIRQEAPAVSALKVGGRPLHERVRRGEQVEPPVRDVVVRSLEIVEVGEGQIALRVRCGKGFYVRALARDLARALGTVGHLASLRRTESGPFRLADAAPAELLREERAGELRARLIGLADACRGMPRVDLSPQARDDVGHGRAIAAGDFAATGPVALVADGELVAVGRREGDVIRVTRGFGHGRGHG